MVTYKLRERSVVSYRIEEKRSHSNRRRRIRIKHTMTNVEQSHQFIQKWLWVCIP